MDRNTYNSPYDTREPDEELVPESPEPLTDEERREQAAHDDRLVAGNAQDDQGQPDDSLEGPDRRNDLPADDVDPLTGERRDVHDGPGPVHQSVAADGTPLVAPLSGESDARSETPDDVLAPEAVTVPGQRLPGDVSPEEIDFDARWHDIKAGFVDDPRDSVEKADALIDEAVSALAARRQSLVDGWKNGDENDTEKLRLALREYRSLFDKLKG